MHGHAEALKTLLPDLCYLERGGIWKYHDRESLFVGDLIDRSPRQHEINEIVRAMVDGDSAAKWEASTSWQCNDLQARQL
jgi:hypothetical protein